MQKSVWAPKNHAQTFEKSLGVKKLKNTLGLD